MVSFSTLMVHVDLVGSNEACLSVAVDLAEQFDAKLVGIAASTLRFPSLEAEGVFSQGLIEQLRSDFPSLLAQAELRFRAAAASRLSVVEWRSATTWPADYIVREARAADLIIAGANRDRLLPLDQFWRLDPGDLVMQAGRPVLVVPPEAESLRLKCAVIAWKDTREARCATNEALPLLKKMRDVVVVEVIADEAERTSSQRRLDDVVSWLGRHEITAVTRVFHFPQDRDPMEKLWEYGADIIVAGAYGHARLREWVFGGFTRDLLSRSPQCAFLAH